MNIAVGVVTFERPSYLRETIESLIAQTRPADELIIIDDSNDDRTANLVDEYRETVTDVGTDLIYRHRTDSPDDGTGMTDARNDVLDYATGDVICYIDDDVFCPEDWLRTYETAYNKFPNAAAIGGPAIRVKERGEEINILRTNENQNRLNKYGECITGDSNWVPSEPVQTSHFIGANMSFRATVLETIEGFNPVYKGPAFLEEIDVMARLWKQERELIYHPEPLIYHFTAGDIVQKRYQKIERWYWQARNNIVFRYHTFPETFFVGLFRTLIYTKGWPGSVLKNLAIYFLKRDLRRLQAIKGYIDGIRQVFFED